MAGPLTVAGSVFCRLGFTRSLTSSAVLSGRGIRSVVKSLGLREEELQDMEPDDLEAMGDASLDTFNEKVARIEGDAERYQEFLRKKTIHNKYFKSMEPREENMLTWSMKEQLKYLHSSDPSQWTPEVLSKSFPISPEGVVKLLQARWTPKSQNEREKHDRAVVARWKKHMKGQIGSFKILEKALTGKFATEKLPSPVMGTESVLHVLEGLRFDGEEPSVAKEVNQRNKLPRQPKMRGKSFYSIIEDYEAKTSKEEKKGEENNSSSTNNMIGIRGPPQYEGSYTRVTGSAGTGTRRLPSCLLPATGVHATQPLSCCVSGGNVW